MSTEAGLTQRALLLMGQNRHDLAEQQLRQSLAVAPDDSLAHALLAQCLAVRERYTEATDEARKAVALDPESAFAHYALASVYDDRDMLREGLPAIEEAIRIDPFEPSYWALLAGIRLQKLDTKGCLEACEQGLAINPEHSGCTNLRGVALTRLGRRDEAGATIGAALSRNPESAVAHANMGWKLLHESQPHPAMEHFREALRLDPDMDWARQGIIEAMKARNFIYRWFLRYMLFMSTLSSTKQWALIVGGFLGYRAAIAVSKQSPDLAPFLWPVLVAYVAFVAMLWFANPIFNLMLCASRFGRAALTTRQKAFCAWLAATMAIGGSSFAAGLATGSSFAEEAGIVFLLLCIPVAAVEGIADKTRQTVSAGLVGGLFGMGLLHLFGPPSLNLGQPLVWICFLSLVAVNVLNSMPARAKR